MDFLKLAAKRYSARNFTDRVVEKEKMDIILEAGRIAPTAANKQPQRILVVQSEEGREKLRKGARYYDAPVVFIVCVDKEDVWVRKIDQYDSGQVDAAIITDHMMLAATDQGLDSLWMSWFDPLIIRKEFSIPDNYEIVDLLAVGYNGNEPLSPHRHGETRKPLGETVFYESFE